MYSKKVFSVLVALFALLFFSGCGGGGSGGSAGDDEAGVHKYVSEWEYFPKFEAPVIKVLHMVTKNYTSLDDYDHDEQSFKSKYPNKWYKFMDAIVVEYPDSRFPNITQLMLSPTGYSATFGITLTSDMVRDNGLFEELFGNLKGTNAATTVAKTFTSSITSQFNEYGALLESKGFEKSTTASNMWTKGINGQRFYSWNFVGQVAGWSILN
ncbi:MAG: hypothetical protein LBG21_03915 [Campylobacteraceae bacterium]|jgi:hypothetical protein|nr:hypothetical protein [Campylobacteraceae bacterium]